MLGFDVFAIQLNFITKGIAVRFDTSIMSSFLKFLGMIEVFLVNNYQIY